MSVFTILGVGVVLEKFLLPNVGFGGPFYSLYGIIIWGILLHSGSLISSPTNQLWEILLLVLLFHPLYISDFVESVGSIFLSFRN